MTKHKYAGILARSIALDDEDARKEALEALCTLYGVAVPETVDPLARALLEAHVPAFRPRKPPSKQARSRSGRKRKLSAKDIILASSEARALQLKGLPRTRACEIIWKRKYQGHCQLGTFIQTISRYAVWGPPIGATADEIAAGEKGREEAIDSVTKMITEICKSQGASPEQTEAFRAKLGLRPEQIRMRIEERRCFHLKTRRRSSRNQTKPKG